MFIIKKTYPLLILIISFILLTSHTLLANRKNKLLKEIELEKSHLNIIQSEVKRIQGIIKKREQVEQLKNEGQYAKIKNLFIKDFAKADSAYNQQNYKKTIIQLNDLRYIYKQPAYIQKIIFLKGKIAIELGLYQQAYQLLNKYVTEYSQFHNIEEAKYYLQFAYFNLGKYDDIVALSKDYKGKRDERYKFILATAYYATNKFEKAFKIANELISNEDYSFDSQFLTGLCIRKVSSNQDAISYFQVTIDSEFNLNRLRKLYLTLARIYYSDKDYLNGLMAYKNYIKIVGLNNIEDDILYEMGWCALNGGKTTTAEYLFKKILEKKPRSDYYDKAIFSIGIILSRMGRIDEAIKIADERITKNQALYDYIEEKKQLLKLYKEITIIKNKKNDEKIKNTIAQQEEEIRTQLYDSNIILSEFLGEDIEYHQILSLIMLEEEIIFYNILLEEIKRLENLFEKRGEKIVLKQIDKRISYTDSLLKMTDFDLQVDIFLSKFPYFHKRDIEYFKEFFAEKKSIQDTKKKMELLILSYFQEKFGLTLDKENLIQELENLSIRDSTEFINKVTTLISEVYNTSERFDNLLNEFEKQSAQNTIFIEELGNEKESFEYIKKNLYGILQIAKGKNDSTITNKIERKIGKVDSTISELDKELKIYLSQHKKNNELRKKFIKQQKLVRNQKEALEEYKKELTNKLKEKIKKMLVESKKNVSDEIEIIETEYEALLTTLTDVIQYKIQASHYAISDFLLEGQAIVEDEYFATQKALSEQQKLYKELLKDLDRQ
ncbi:MAG: tetratricopeptide repeat protein [Candidatus Cloacimonetes bacterium]|nr:tetratricopeptide repeat protein [Candidatus Cloacimonadota bacterium]